MRYFVKVADEEWELVVDGDRVEVNGKEVHARILDGPSGEPVALELAGGTHALVAGPPQGSDGRILHLDGRRHRVEAETERERRVRQMKGVGAASRGPRPLKAPMPGLVVKVDVEAGQAVEAGQGLVIVEAMKMENELQAEAEGVVARVHVEAGQAVEKDEVLLEFQEPAGDDED
jgi:pyruvate carboxylase subunit B